MSKPDYNAFTVIERDGDKQDFWQQIGAGFINKDGSITVKVNAWPLDGKLVLRKPKPKTEG